MNPEIGTRSYYGYSMTSKKQDRRDKVRQSQLYKKANQTHPAFKKNKR